MILVQYMASENLISEIGSAQRGSSESGCQVSSSSALRNERRDLSQRDRTHATLSIFFVRKPMIDRLKVEITRGSSES
jgi:hypothetical protein